MNKFEKFNNEIKTYFRSEVVTILTEVDVNFHITITIMLCMAPIKNYYLKVFPWLQVA